MFLLLTLNKSLPVWTADITFHKHDEDYFSKSLTIYDRRYAIDNNHNPGPTPAEFDDYLYRMADVVWPHALTLTEKDYTPPDEY